MAKKRFSIWQELRAWLIVAVITVLIWLYAEANTLQSRQVPVKVRFVPPPATELFVDQPDQGHDVQLTYSCTADRIGDVEKLLNNPIELEVSANATDDDSTQTVTLIERLTAHLPLAALGVTVEAVRPPSVTIDVYRLVRISLGIDVVYADAQFTAEPAVEPAEAEVLLPTELVAEAADLRLEVRLDKDFLAESEVDVSDTKPADVFLSESLRARLPGGFRPGAEPEKVVVSYTLRNQNQTIVKNVPVQVQIVPQLVGKYRIEMEVKDREDQIELSGPRDLIKKIWRDEERVELYVPLTVKDLDKGRLEAVQPQIRVPLGVNVENMPPKLVSLIFEEIEEAEKALTLDNGEAERLSPVPSAVPDKGRLP